MRTEWAAASGHKFWTPGTDCVVLEPLLCRFGFMFCFCCLAEFSWDWQWVSFSELSAFCCIDLCFSHLPLWAEGAASPQCDAATSSLHGVFPEVQCLTFTLHSIPNLFFFPLNTDWPYWSASPHFKLFNNLVSTCTFATSVIFLKWNWSHTLTWVKFQTFLNMYKKVFFFSVNVLNTSHKEFEDVIQALYGANNWMWVLIHLCCCLCCFLCCSIICCSTNVYSS